MEATSKGQTIDSLAGLDARETFNNNNLFRQASFRPKKGIEFEELVKASEAFRETFGKEVRELNAGAIVNELRREVAHYEDTVATALGQLNQHRLPGVGVLDVAIGQMKAILRGSEDNALATFNSSHRSIKDAIKRASELEQSLSEPRLQDLERARMALNSLWPFLEQEADVSEDLRGKATTLRDILERESFYKELPAIDQNAKAIQTEYDERYEEALAARISVYGLALDRLVATSGWTEVDQEQRRRLAAPFERGRAREADRLPIPQLRSESDACDGRLRAAIGELRRIIDGERVVSVSLGSYFSGGIETEEQLDSALQGVREECSKLIGAGKKVIIQ